MTTPAQASVRHARLWDLLGVILVLGTVVTGLLPAKQMPKLPLNDKIEHIIAYLVLALWFGGLLEPRRYWRLTVWLLALGGGIEIAQGLMHMGREADWFDFYADATGVVAGIALCQLGVRHWVRWAERLLGLAGG
ncbi:MAG: VanZ family protein [Steroidobacterales bacterium]